MRYWKFTGEADILLVVCPPFSTMTVPLGLGYLARSVEANGYRPDIYDLNAMIYKDTTSLQRRYWDFGTMNSLSPRQFLDSFLEDFSKVVWTLIKRFVSSPLPILGLSTTHASVPIGLFIAHQVKLLDPSKLVIMGGPGVFDNPLLIDTLKLIDIFVVGEGERPLGEILKRYQKTGKVEECRGIPGTVVLFQGDYSVTLPTDPILALDEVPFPTYQQFDLSVYGDKRCATVPILFSRGCINRCHFCSDCLLSAPYRFRSPDQIIAEIRHHVSRYNVRRFTLNDLLCNGNIKQLEKISTAIIEENLDIEWAAYAAIRKGMSDEILFSLRRSGCTFLHYGFESGSDRVLERMNKRYNVAMAEDLLRRTHLAGIKTAINVIIGYPGETEEDFQETLRFLERNGDYIGTIGNISSCVIMPSSELGRNMANHGIISPVKPRKDDPLASSSGDGDLQDYCAIDDNTPERRALRLRKLLESVHRAGIPYEVINRFPHHDPDFAHFYRELNEAYPRIEANPGTMPGGKRRERRAVGAQP